MKHFHCSVARYWLCLWLCVLAVLPAWAVKKEKDGIVYDVDLSTKIAKVIGVKDKAITSAAIPQKDVIIGNLKYSVHDNYAVCTGFAENKDLCCDTLRIPDEIQVDGKSYIVEEIGDNAFDTWGDTYIKNIELPTKLKRIGFEAFLNWTSNPNHLISDNLVLPDSLQSIGCAAFGNANIKRIYIPSSVREIGEQAFAGCSKLNDISVSKDNTVYSGFNTYGYAVLYNDKEDILCNVCGSGGDYFLAFAAKSVARGAFQGCKNLKNVELHGFYGENLSIGESVFFACDSLERVELIYYGNITLAGDSILYDESTGTNALRDMFGDLPSLRYIEFNPYYSNYDDNFIPTNVVKSEKGIYYTLEKAKGYDDECNCAHLLFMPGGYEKDSVRLEYAEIYDNGVTRYLPVMGVKSGAFSENVKDVFFVLNMGDNSEVGQDFKVKYNIYYNRQDTIIYHVPYPCQIETNDYNVYSMMYYEDAFTAPYKTIYFNYDYIIPKGMHGAVITGAEGNKLKIEYQYAPGDIVPANTGLLLKKDDNLQINGYFIFDIYPWDTSTILDVHPKEVVGENYLEGCGTYDYNITSVYTGNLSNKLYYKLSHDKNNENIGFYWGEKNGEGFMTNVNRAYLVLPRSLAPQMSNFLIEGNEITTINFITNNGYDNTNSIYSLGGCKIGRNQVHNGVYIENGKKVIVK